MVAMDLLPRTSVTLKRPERLSPLSEKEDSMSNPGKTAKPADKKRNSLSTSLTRRGFMQVGALAGAAAMTSGRAASKRSRGLGLGKLEEATIAEMQTAMEDGGLTSESLVNHYLARIRSLDESGPRVNSILEINPDAKSIARDLDRERRRSGPRGPLHGIPIVLKDNIDTADRMQTAAGSLALVGDPPLQDSTVAARLRAAGAVILAKANLSEWANFRGFNSSSGWSGRDGQCNNPYAIDRNPCGSSSGSAAAVSANFCAAALGTETDGSIVCPSSACGVVGIKPTVGLTSRAGVVPISATQDTVGPHGRTVADAAAVLGALTGVDPRDPATSDSAGKFFTDYTQFLDPDGLNGARIGVARNAGFGASEETDEIIEEAIQALADAGATVVDPAPIPNLDLIFDPEIVVLIFEFKRDLNAYLATRTGVPISSLADAIAFNQANEVELRFFGQQLFELSEAEIFSEADYLAALANGPQLAGPLGLDAVLDDLALDALVAPTASPAWTTDLINGDLFLLGSSSAAAVAGYPLLTIPAGFSFGLPVGMTFMGRAFSEPTLIRLASGFEHVTQVRRAPEFLPTLELEHASAKGGPAPMSAQRLERLQNLVRKPQIPAVRLHGLL